jgi:hypothetical protein
MKDLINIVVGIIGRIKVIWTGWSIEWKTRNTTCANEFRSLSAQEAVRAKWFRPETPAHGRQEKEQRGVYEQTKNSIRGKTRHMVHSSEGRVGRASMTNCVQSASAACHINEDGTGDRKALCIRPTTPNVLIVAGVTFLMVTGHVP